MMKRSLDFAIALLAVVFLIPLFVAVAAWIRFDSKGPVFYTQVRVGRHGQPFRMFKFRSMTHGAPVSGREITVGGDPRITHAGAFLRRAKLDELPQLFNVLMGDMSLVGPRPEVPKYVALYPEAARRQILSVKPGITDEASLQFLRESEILARSRDPDAAYVEEILPLKIELYMKYVATRSLIGDLRIIWRTIARVVRIRD
jgi:lipopolysaccharide/colanic/teichoic acid biosynthesis glycosyltransferase